MAATTDLSVQTKAEVTGIIETQQEKCLQETGDYCQFIEGKLNKDLFGTKIKEHDYKIKVDTHERYEEKWFTIEYIEPYVPVASST